MLFNFFRKTETQKKETSRSEVLSKIAKAKRNGRTSVHIDARIPLELHDELSLMGCSVYTKPGFSGTNIYWKKS